jgi:hypothetical protein
MFLAPLIYIIQLAAMPESCFLLESKLLKLLAHNVWTLIEATVFLFQESKPWVPNTKNWSEEKTPTYLACGKVGA